MPTSSNKRPVLLDLFCCSGGASIGYERAGFRVLGVDLSPQPNYWFPFHRGDALEALQALVSGLKVDFWDKRLNDGTSWGHEAIRLADISAVHASPPCQLYSTTHRINRSDYPDLIAPTRTLLEETGLPWVIENVVAAAPQMRNPVMLCAAMPEISRPMYRHRLFEGGGGFMPSQPDHPAHSIRQAKMGRAAQDDEYMHIVGNFSGVPRARRDMEMPHASRRELAEAIPPAYAEHIGRQMLALIGANA